jgi:inositol hexakisphosphate/diphosphoinositol-pentakisphosphate kinase
MSTVLPMMNPKLPSKPMKNLRVESSTPTLPASNSEDNLTLNSSKESEEELVCIIAVIRHGDRTPKQKIKIKVTNSLFLDYYHSIVTNSRTNVKIKSKTELISFVDMCNLVLNDYYKNHNNNVYSSDSENIHKWEQILGVMTHHEIGGIYRKVQIKPQKWENIEILNEDGKSTVNEKATELLLIIKWGGSLTPLGKRQAEQLGTHFRHEMYPDPSGGGVLRLHSTFRHDLKIRSSDEGRVMKTAAAFAKGLLELEGQLGPLLASLVSVEDKDSSQMLDHYDNYEIREMTDRCKESLNDVFQLDIDFTAEVIEKLAPHVTFAVKDSMLKLGNPLRALSHIHDMIKCVCRELESLLKSDSSTQRVPLSPVDEKSAPGDLYREETLQLMLDRWKKLSKGFYNAKQNKFDLTKVPELYDMCKYDALHNSHLELGVMFELYHQAKIFADCIVPQEYGIDQNQKRSIGIKMCGQLLNKIKYDLTVAQSNTQKDMTYLLDHSHADELQIRTLGRCVRTRLYFTSESHLITLFNVLSNPLPGRPGAFSDSGLEMLQRTPEVSYLSHLIIRLFDDVSKAEGSANKYRCEIRFSPGRFIIVMIR